MGAYQKASAAVDILKVPYHAKPFLREARYLLRAVYQRTDTINTSFFFKSIFGKAHRAFNTKTKPRVLDLLNSHSFTEMTNNQDTRYKQ